MSSGSKSNSQSRGGTIVSKDVQHEGKFLRQTLLTYQLESESRTRKWESCERTGRDKHTTDQSPTADAVALACTCDDGSSEPKIVVVYQFRPPVGTTTVELPAGLIDTNESVQQAGLRELKEEVGIIASPTDQSCVQLLSPGVTNEGIVTLFAHADLTSDENKNAHQALEEGERISVGLLPLSSLSQSLKELEQSGYAIKVC